MLKRVKKDLKCTEPRLVDLNRRPVIGVSLGPDCAARLPHADKHDPHTARAGVFKRFGVEPPPILKDELIEFRAFVRSWVRTHFKPLCPESDVSVESWLRDTAYPEWRKEELLAAAEDTGDIWDDVNHRCSSFVKHEGYLTYKHARAINSRTDAFKCAVGPVFKLIEKVVYDHPSFIKHVPVRDRPEYIMGMLYREGAKYVATDFTAFESLFVKELMEACEFELYEWMTSKLSVGPEFMALCKRVLAGTNVCRFKQFVVRLLATRMSGEMCTSLGNGFSNLMFMLYTCKKKGCTEVTGVVEGDDGLFTMVGSPPTTDDFARLGLVIKLEVHTVLSSASFCGLVFDPTDLVNVTDPRKVLASFGWTSGDWYSARPSRLHALLRSKAMSLVHQYPGCPIVQELGLYGLRVTSHITVSATLKAIQNKSHGSWRREELLRAFGSAISPREVPMATRLLVESLYGISVDVQLKIEKYLSSKNDLEQILCPYVEMVMPQVWLDHYGAYVIEDERLSSNLFYPCGEWVQIPLYNIGTRVPPNWDAATAKAT